jgi:hypothetical protein
LDRAGLVPVVQPRCCALFQHDLVRCNEEELLAMVVVESSWRWYSMQAMEWHLVKKGPHQQPLFGGLHSAQRLQVSRSKSMDDKSDASTIRIRKVLDMVYEHVGLFFKVLPVPKPY